MNQLFTKFKYLVFFLCFVGALQSCNVTKHLGEGEYLLKKNEIKINKDGAKLNKGEIEALIRQKPNHLIAGSIPFHMAIYNLVDPEKEEIRQKEREKRVKLQQEKEDKFYFTRWLREIGEKPVVWDKYKTKETDKQIRQYLRNKGYYDAEVTSTVDFGTKKCKVIYVITPGLPYKINTIEYKIEDEALKPYIEKDKQNSLVRKGNVFDVDVLQSERFRLENVFKNLGYYDFSKEFIYFTADTTIGNHLVNLTLGLKSYEKNVGNSIEYTSHKRYKIDSVKVYTNYDAKKALLLGSQYLNEFDATNIDSSKFVFYKDDLFKIRPQSILRESFIQPDSVYKLDLVRKTYRHVSMLSAIKLVNIKFDKSNYVDDALDCKLFLTPQMRQSYTAELEGSNASGNWGVAGNLTYTNNNIFRGAETFDFKIRGARETLSNAKVKRLNTNEIGFESNIRFPNFIFPFVSEEFSRRNNLKTYSTLIFNYQDRPEYDRTIANFRFGYYWKSPRNRFVRYSVYPIDINMVDIVKTDSLDSYFLRYSYSNHLILGSSFSFIYDNQDLRKPKSHWYLRANYETAGNAMRLIAQSQDLPKDADGLYMISKRVFAQYQKFDVDYRYYRKIAKNDWAVTRLFFGLGVPFGNSKNGLPFIKKYYSGGATSIRAWKVRALGPGSYKDTANYFFNQTADLKLEFNIEYRFKMFWVIEGAAFVDAGNIWSITKGDEREGAKFKFNHFYRQIAVGTGLGFRFDFSFFIIRFDFGMKLRDPSEPQDKRIIVFNRKYKRDDFSFNFGIGYPF